MVDSFLSLRCDSKVSESCRPLVGGGESSEGDEGVCKITDVTWDDDGSSCTIIQLFMVLGGYLGGPPPPPLDGRLLPPLPPFCPPPLLNCMMKSWLVWE